MQILHTHLLSKIDISKKEGYLILKLKEALTDSEFTELQNLVLQKVSENSATGVILNLSELMVIDSFTTKVLQDLAYSTACMERSLILVGIKDHITEVMEKQGLHLNNELIEKSKNITEAISR